MSKSLHNVYRNETPVALTEELHKVGWNRDTIGIRVMIFTRSNPEICITVKTDNGGLIGRVD